jgi:hypothetical protein
MMCRAIATLLVLGLLGSLAPAEEPKGNVIRPKRVDAKVKGCQVSEPGEYEATAGDLIELEYTFVIAPQCMPKEVARKTDRGAIYPSKLGIRNLIVPRMVGTGTYLFYFDARDVGTGTAFVVIDNVKYEYQFEVAENPNKKPKKKKQAAAAEAP